MNVGAGELEQALDAAGLDDDGVDVILPHA